MFSWNDLKNIVVEIDTIADIYYYLKDRFRYLKIADIPLGKELNVLGYYKSKSNEFPDKPVDFYINDCWTEYKTKMGKEISKREKHNLFSSWLDALEGNFSNQRKLLDGYPIGLYFAWELGSISRRERAYIGEELESAQDWFNAGNPIKVFARLNNATKNWDIFYYSKSEPLILHKELEKMIELKLIKEIEENSFNQGVYGFGFQVSVENPPQLLGIVSAIVIGADIVKGKYSKADVEEARRNFGKKGSGQITVIEEFPKE